MEEQEKSRKKKEEFLEETRKSKEEYLKKLEEAASHLTLDKNLGDYLLEKEFERQERAGKIVADRKLKKKKNE